MLATCAGDGAIELHRLDPLGNLRSTERSTIHIDRTKKMCTRKDDPHFLLSCSEDCTVRRFDLRTPLSQHCASKIVGWPLQLRKARRSLYSISLCPMEGNHFVVAGDMPWVFLYDLRKNDIPVMATNGTAMSSSSSDAPSLPIARRELHAPVPCCAFCRSGDAQNAEERMTHISGVAMAHDGRRVAASFSGGGISIFDITR